LFLGGVEEFLGKMRLNWRKGERGKCEEKVKPILHERKREN